MRGPELRLILLALVLGQAPRGPAAPVPAGEGAVLAKMYPRGNHWAVGHLMGKKSTGDSRYAPEGDGTERLREYIQWEEAARSLLGLIRAQGRGDPQPQRPQPAWEVADSSDFKDAGSRCKVGRLSAPGSQGEGRIPSLRGQ